MTESLQASLRAFLEDLGEIGLEYDELTDTDVRETLHRVLTYCIVWGNGERELPMHFGMLSSAADLRLRERVGRFIVEANQILATARVPTGQARLDRLQDSHLRTRNGRLFDEFFGYRAIPLAPEECEEVWTGA